MMITAKTARELLKRELAAKKKNEDAVKKKQKEMQDKAFETTMKRAEDLIRTAILTHKNVVELEIVHNTQGFNADVAYRVECALKTVGYKVKPLPGGSGMTCLVVSF